MKALRTCLPFLYGTCLLVRKFTHPVFFSSLRLYRPMPYWLAAGRMTTAPARHPTTHVLTAEQFRQLPEIIYPGKEGQCVEDDEEEDHDNDGRAKNNNNHDNDCDIDIDSSNVDPPEQYQHTQSTTVKKNDDNDEASHPSDEADTALITMCTTCSICIDDFERGERLTILPKCKHAFHRDCLEPWLTERQGCCPLCKASVVDRADTDENDEEGDDDTTSSPRHDDATDVAQVGLTTSVSDLDDPGPIPTVDQRVAAATSTVATFNRGLHEEEDDVDVRLEFVHDRVDDDEIIVPPGLTRGSMVDEEVTEERLELGYDGLEDSVHVSNSSLQISDVVSNGMNELSSTESLDSKIPARDSIEQDLVAIRETITTVAALKAIDYSETFDLERGTLSADANATINGDGTTHLTHLEITDATGNIPFEVCDSKVELAVAALACPAPRCTGTADHCRTPQDCSFHSVSDEAEQNGNNSHLLQCMVLEDDAMMTDKMAYEQARSV
jgi:hypothetical protein